MKKRRWVFVLPLLALLYGCAAEVNDAQTLPSAKGNATVEENELKEQELVTVMPVSLEIKANDEIVSGVYWEKDAITAYSGPSSYPRLFALKNGTMLCGFDTGEDGGQSVIKIVRSNDDGLTWGDKVKVSGFNELGCANPSIVELPDGDIWVSYRANADQKDGYYSSIRNSVSRDGGLTWEYHSLVAEEFGVGGVYEPHFGWIGDKLVVFYANDSRNAVTQHMEQNIEFKVWENGAWSEKYIASDGTQTHSRDGMPVWDLMKDGRYVLVVEATNESGFPFVIQIKTSPDGFDWSEKLRNIYVPYGKGRKAGAPYVAALPDGRLAVAFQTDDEALRAGDDVSYMKVMISDDDKGTSFSEPLVPFLIPGDRCSVWNGLYVHNGYLYAATSANYPKSGIFIRRAALNPHTESGQNVVFNSDFRFQNTQNWYIDYNGKTYHSEFPAKRFENNAGNYSLVLVNNKGLDMTLTQEIMGLQEGNYTFKMKASADAQQTVKVILTQGSESAEILFNVGDSNEIETFFQSGIKAQSGAAVLSVVMVGDGARELTLDDIELVRD